MDRLPRRRAASSALAAFIAGLLVACGGSTTSPQNQTPAEARVNADGSINLGIKTMYKVKPIYGDDLGPGESSLRMYSVKSVYD